MAGAFQIIREQMPQFLDEPHAREFMDVAGALIPTTPQDVALEAVFAPVSKPIRLAALGASIASTPANARSRSERRISRRNHQRCSSLKDE